MSVNIHQATRSNIPQASTNSVDHSHPEKLTVA
jgi:hypothetical protein